MQNEFLNNDEDSALKAYRISKSRHLDLRKEMQEALCESQSLTDVNSSQQIEGIEPFEPPEK